MLRCRAYHHLANYFDPQLCLVYQDWAWATKQWLVIIGIIKLNIKIRVLSNSQKVRVKLNIKIRVLMNIMIRVLLNIMDYLKDRRAGGESSYEIGLSSYRKK